MDLELERKWHELVSSLEEEFGGGLDLKSILFLIGVQELGQGYRKFKKDEKVDLMHIAICTLLEPYGYYNFKDRDEEGWPHFELSESLPPLEKPEQEELLKRSILEYFDQST